MAAKKKTVKKTVEAVEETAVETVPETMPQAKLDFLQMMASYKAQNPTKYAQKEAGFLKRLASL